MKMLAMALMIVMAGCAGPAEPETPETLIVGKVERVVNPGVGATREPMADVTVTVGDVANVADEDRTNGEGYYEIVIGDREGPWHVTITRDGSFLYTVSNVPTTIGRTTTVDFTLNEYVGWCVTVDGDLRTDTCRYPVNPPAMSLSEAAWAPTGMATGPRTTSKQAGAELAASRLV